MEHSRVASHEHVRKNKPGSDFKFLTLPNLFRDWIALYSDYYLDTLADNVAEWYYLNNPTKIAGRQSNPVGRYTKNLFEPVILCLTLLSTLAYHSVFGVQAITRCFYSLRTATKSLQVTRSKSSIGRNVCRRIVSGC